MPVIVSPFHSPLQTTPLSISEAAAEFGLYYAPDPSSQIACTIGGNVAENSGGVHCLKYGLTVHNIQQIKIITIEGEILTIGGSGLTGEDRVSYEVFVRARRDALAEMEFPDWMMPINQFRSAENSFARLGSGGSSQPFETVADYDNFLSRIAGFSAWSAQAIENMRGGQKVDDPNAEDQRQALEKYTIDLTERAEQGKLDPVIGRDQEIRRVIQVLSRRTKNNPVLIGEQGVGQRGERALKAVGRRGGRRDPRRQPAHGQLAARHPVPAASRAPPAPVALPAIPVPGPPPAGWSWPFQSAAAPGPATAAARTGALAGHCRCGPAPPGRPGCPAGSWRWPAGLGP